MRRDLLARWSLGWLSLARLGASGAGRRRDDGSAFGHTASRPRPFPRGPDVWHRARVGRRRAFGRSSDSQHATERVAHRCGTVPDSHRIPLPTARKSIHLGGGRERRPQMLCRGRGLLRAGQRLWGADKASCARWGDGGRWGRRRRSYGLRGPHKRGRAEFLPGGAGRARVRISVAQSEEMSGAYERREGLKESAPPGGPRPKAGGVRGAGSGAEPRANPRPGSQCPAVSGTAGGSSCFTPGSPASAT